MTSSDRCTILPVGMYQSIFAALPLHCVTGNPELMVILQCCQRLVEVFEGCSSQILPIMAAAYLTRRRHWAFAVWLYSLWDYHFIVDVSPRETALHISLPTYVGRWVGFEALTTRSARD
jgi:hypothetical protein